MPEVALAPDHAPEAAQDVALVEDQARVEDAPLVTDVGFAASDKVGTGGGVPPWLLATSPPPPQAASMRHESRRANERVMVLHVPVEIGTDTIRSIFLPAVGDGTRSTSGAIGGSANLCAACCLRQNIRKVRWRRRRTPGQSPERAIENSRATWDSSFLDQHSNILSMVSKTWAARG